MDFVQALAMAEREQLEAMWRASSRALYVGDDTLCVRVLNQFEVGVKAYDRTGLQLARDGFWESWTLQVLAERIKPEWSCADIGSSWGYYTCVLAHLSQRVTAYDPVPILTVNLRRTAEINGLEHKVEIVNAALFFSGDAWLSGKAATLTESRVVVDKPEGPALNVDTVQRIDPVDFIKVDTPGSTGTVMQVVIESSPRAEVMLECPPGYESFDQLKGHYFVEQIGYDSICRPIDQQPEGVAWLWLTPR